VIGNVDLVEHRVEPETHTGSEHHVTTGRLKQQFEARLAARSRRR